VNGFALAQTSEFSKFENDKGIPTKRRFSLVLSKDSQPFYRGCENYRVKEEWAMSVEAELLALCSGESRLRTREPGIWLENER